MKAEDVVSGYMKSGMTSSCFHPFCFLSDKRLDFFFFLNTICILGASFKLFWEALHSMKFNFLKTSLLSRPNSVGCR